MKIDDAGSMAKLPPARWQAKVSPDEAWNRDLANSAMGFAQHFARMAAYFNARALGQTHREAVKEACRVVTALRRALRYSYPKDTLSF